MSSLALRTAAPTPVTPLLLLRCLLLALASLSGWMCTRTRSPSRSSLAPRRRRRGLSGCRTNCRSSRSGWIESRATGRSMRAMRRVGPFTHCRSARTNLLRRLPRVHTRGGNARVIPGGVVLDKFQPGPLSTIDQKGLKRIRLRNGLPGRAIRTIEYLVKRPGPVSIQDSALKGGTGRTTVDPR